MDIPVLDDELKREQFVEDSVKLFKLFSRFEYAMKRSDFLKKGSYDGADPDWKEFARALGTDFYNQVKGQDAMRILIEKPPSQLKFRPSSALGAAKAEWSVRTYGQDVEGLFEGVKQVRNNLFHGDKTSPADVGRNSQLIRAAYSVLMEVLVWIEGNDSRKQRFASFVDKITMPLIF
jgi:hypothetical protein